MLNSITFSQISCLPGSIELETLSFMAFRLAQLSAAGRTTIVPDVAAVGTAAVGHDVFCAWSYIADQRLEALRDEYGSEVKWSWQPFPLRPEAIAPDKKQRGLFARHFRRAARQSRRRRRRRRSAGPATIRPQARCRRLVALEAARRESPLLQRRSC